MTKNMFQFLLILFVSVFITGCGLSDTSVESAKNTLVSIDKTLKLINEKKESFPKNELFVKYKKEADKEKLHESIIDLSKHLNSFNNSKLAIEGYIKLDNDKDEVKLINEIKNAKALMDNVSKTIAYAESRLKVYDSFYKSKNEFLTLIETEKNNLTINYKNLIADKDTILKSFPTRENDIKKLTQKIELDSITLIDKLDSVKTKEDIVDFLVILDISKVEPKKLVTEITRLRESLKELNNSVIKILKDTRVDYYAKALIYSWDETSDWDSESTKYLTPIKITEEMANLMESKNIEQIANYPGFFSGYDCKVDQSVCDLYSSTMRSKIFASSGDDTAELWLDNVEEEYFFKYLIIENDKEREEWVKVSESEYNKYAEFEGHEIYSKPYGFFNNEALNAPNPVGISTVGNPKYGEWKTDSSGQSFWAYYGQFRLLSDVIDIFAGNNHRYSRNDYDHWNNNYRNQKYTGSEDRYSYGGSVVNSSGNYKSTGSVNNGNSLRGVGAVTRGRGASGGGK